MTQSVESSVTAEAVLNAPKTVEHGIPLYLASDEALIHILDRYPEELFDINCYDFDAEGQVSLTTGTRGRADGRTVLNAIKAGRLWVNLRSCEDAHPGLWAEVQLAFGRLAPELGGKGAKKMTGQLILSSPTTRVPFHFDAAGVVLFHLRGVKRVWVYPNTEAFLPQDAMEQVIMRTTTEELPYSRIMDGAAWRFDVVPGEALTWPLYAPHRVENQEGLCVSLSMDYQTWGSRITTGAHRANGVLRRWGWKIQPMATTNWAHRTILWAAALAFTRLNLVKNNIKDFERTFDVADANVIMHGEREAA
ncbi:MAG: hypothetical protein Q8R82_07690 [Hyphomonadaceae bacterium]|nr:hypothetical protein [Hyphomonadaceae bacterium]